MDQGPIKEKKKTKPYAEARHHLGGLWPYSVAWVTVIVYIAFEAYRPALRGPFVYDDFGLPFYNPLFQTDSLIAWVSTVRPLLMFSYWINFQLSGRDPYSYHVVNLVLHLANSAAIYLIARRVLAQELPDGFRREMFAVFAAMLFLLHPIQTESVAWIAGRSESLSALFFLYAFTVFLYRPAGPISWRRSAVVLFLFACAVVSKEHTVTLPVILFVTDALWARDERLGDLRRNWWLYIPIILGGLVAAKLIWNVVTKSESAGFSGVGVSWMSYALTQCRVFFVYLRLFLLPVGQNIDYDMPWSSSRFDLGALAAFFGNLALAAVAWRLRRRFPVGSYGFLLFLILLAPTSSFIPIKDPIAEHRLYLPMLEDWSSWPASF